ncbi:MAG: hypothetical protein ACC726_11360 [Chloroflexota bacterium]
MASASPPGGSPHEQVVQDGSSQRKLKGKKYARAVAKAAPNAIRYFIAPQGDDTIRPILELAMAARDADETGDARASQALIALATALYRNEWTKSNIDPVSLNTAIGEAIAAGYPDEPGLRLEAFGEDGFRDICLEPGEEWMSDPARPSLCEDVDGKQVRVDESRINSDKNGTLGLYDGPNEGADVGGVGIHKVTQDKTANDELRGKKFKKAIAMAAPGVARYLAEGSGAGAEQGAIDMVLLGRASDEAGNRKAAKAFMALAVAAYRAGWTASGQTTADFDEALVARIEADQTGVPGLQLRPPDGMIDICLQKKKRGPDFIVDQSASWECRFAGGRVLRVPIEDIDQSKNSTDELYRGDS